MLGERLKQARTEAGLSQRQLCGEEITRNMLSQIESGKARPSMQTLTYLAQKLGKPVSYFLEEETVASPNQQTMAAARQSHARGEYQLCMEQLQAYREPDPLFDREMYLLYALSAIELARQSLKTGKTIYARSLLEKAEQAGKQTPYYTPALERERLLLLYESQPEAAAAVAPLLPVDDRELLLRARAGLAVGAWETCTNVLSAVQEKDGQYHYLMGQALLGQEKHALAAEHFLQAEAAYPQPCAKALETCYRELEDYKMAYHYACKQR